MKRKVEVFIAGCPLCEPVVDMVKELACENCEVIIHDIVAQCETKECLAKAEEYGVKRVPAVAVDGKLLECCAHNEITREALAQAGVGKS